MKTTPLLTCLAFFIVTQTNVVAQTLLSNKTKAEARLNKEKSFALKQQEIFALTSWAGANVAELIGKWGNPTKKSETASRLTVYTYENNFSGSGGNYTPGYVVTDQYGNIIEQKGAQDNTYSYNFTDYYDFYVDTNNIIIHVKTGTR